MRFTGTFVIVVTLFVELRRPRRRRTEGERDPRPRRGSGSFSGCPRAATEGTRRWWTVSMPPAR